MRGRGRPKSPGLTPREQDVVDLVGRELTNREIAERLEISEPAVRYHLNQVYAKTGIGYRKTSSRGPAGGAGRCPSRPGSNWPASEARPRP